MNSSEFEAGFAKMRLLVIDDDASLLKLAQSMLKQLGVDTILAAQDSSQAFAMFQENQQIIDVILCDWNMPGMSGLDLLKIARALRPDVAFIMMTGFADMARIVQARDNGASSYIKKPFTLEELRKKLAVIERIRSHREARVPV